MSDRSRPALGALAALCLCLPAPGTARAEAEAEASPPPAFEDFTYRRIAVPDRSGGPRITVQIDPAEQARRLAAVPPLPQIVTPGAPTDTRPAGASHAWFWDRVPHARDASAGRYGMAMTALSNPPSGEAVPQPRLQHLQRIAAEHGPAILRATVGSRVSPALAVAVIAVESAGRGDAVSHAGAEGLMQLIPATAARFEVADSFEPTENIRGGVAYLNWLMREFDRDVVLALAGYNAGEGAVRRHNGVPPFAETRDYVPKVLAAWRVARGLCATAPELPSDPCVFRIAQAGVD